MRNMGQGEYAQRCRERAGTMRLETWALPGQSALAVASQSQPGRGHSVRLMGGRAYSCDCLGYAHHGYCIHMGTVDIRP